MPYRQKTASLLVERKLWQGGLILAAGRVRSKKKNENKTVCENTFFLKICLPSAKKSKLPSHQVFGVFALEVKKILQVTPSKLRREMGMYATTKYVQQQQ